MKKIGLMLLTAALLFACTENHSDANLQITGNIKGLKQGRLYIKRIVDTSMVTIDSIIVNGNPKFESHIKIESPEMLYLILDRGQTNSIDDRLPFFAEPGKMRIESSIDRFYAGAKITGSENQKIYDEFLKIKNRFTEKNMELVQKNIEATKNGNIKQLDSIIEQNEQLIKKRYRVTANFALNHAKYEVAPYVALSEIYDANIRYLDTIRKSMTPEVANSHYGKMLTKFVEDRKKEEAAHIK